MREQIEPTIPVPDLEEAERRRRVQQREEETWPALLQWPTVEMQGGK